LLINGLTVTYVT